MAGVAFGIAGVHTWILAVKFNYLGILQIPKEIASKPWVCSERETESKAEKRKQWFLVFEAALRKM